MLKRRFIAQNKNSLEIIAKIHVGITVDCPEEKGKNTQS